MKLNIVAVTVFSIFIYMQAGCSQSDRYIEPTGTYTLNPEVDREKLPINSYFGDIQVLALDKDKIAVTFFISKGAPSYNMGTFIDTLRYKNNHALFKSTVDSTCSIKLDFREKGIQVNQEAENINAACGFGHAVVAKGLFVKQSAEEPKLAHPVTGEPLK